MHDSPPKGSVVEDMQNLQKAMDNPKRIETSNKLRHRSHASSPTNTKKLSLRSLRRIIYLSGQVGLDDPIARSAKKTLRARHKVERQNRKKNRRKK